MLNVGTEVTWLLDENSALYEDRNNPHLYPEDYEQYLRNLAEYVTELGISHDIVYSFWNEGNRVESFGGTNEDYLALFRIFHDTLREELGGDIEISSPSYGYFGTGIRDDDADELLTAFFDNALDHGLTIEYLGLHLFARIGIDFEDLGDRIERYWDKFGPNSIYAPVGLEEFIVDESGNDDDHLTPASIFAWLHLADDLDLFRLSRTGIDDAKTLCEVPGLDTETCVGLYGGEIYSDNNWNESLNGALTHNELQPEIEIGPRPIWWVYRYYTLGRRNRVQSESDDSQVIALSSRESDAPDRAQTVVALFGKSTVVESNPDGAVKDIAVALANVDQLGQFAGATRVRLDLEKIPYDGLGIYALEEPVAVTRGRVLELDPDGGVELELDDVDVHDVYRAQLYPLASFEDDPGLSVFPLEVEISAYQGIPAYVREIVISNSGGGTLDWSASGLDGGGMFTFSPSSGTLGWGESQTVLMTVDLAGLVEGDLSETIQFDAPGIAGAPVLVPVDIEVLANDLPVAYDVSAITEEEVDADVVLDFDDDMIPGPHSVEVTVAPQFGEIVEQELGWYVYTPDSGFAGEDSFRWLVNDGAAQSNEAVATITVEGLPEISMDRSSFEWTVYRGTAEVSDSFVLTNVGLGAMNWTTETLPVEMSFVFDPADGTLEPGESVTVSMVNDISNSLAGDYFGSVGVLDSNARNHPFEVPVTLSVLVNEDPVALQQDLITSEGIPVAVVLGYTDDSLPGPYTFTIVSPPVSGTLIEQGPGLYEYTPSVGFTGQDSFAWTVNDGLLESNTAIVRVDVNQIPIAHGQSVATLEDEAVEVALTYTDDGLPGPHSVVLTHVPTHGSLVELSPGKYTYTPAVGYYGPDEFRFVVDDGLIQSAEAVVAIDVAGVPEVALDRSSLDWTIFQGEAEVVDTLTLTNVGGGTLDWVVGLLPVQVSAVTVTPGAGLLAPGDSVELEVRAATANIPAGSYGITLGVLDSAETNYPSSIPVTLTILEVP